MKKSFFYFATLALWCTVSLSSCVKEAVMTDSGETTQATVKLTLTGSAGTRALSESVLASNNTDESKISNLVVGFFDASEKVISIQSKDISSTTTPPFTEEFKFSLPTTGLSGCTAVAVANAPTATIDALKVCVTKSDFLACTVSMSSEIKYDFLPMSGDVKTSADASPFTLKDDVDLEVKLVRMVARIGLTSIKTEFSAPYTSATLKLQRVFLRNVISTAFVNPTFTMPSSLSADSYLTGGGTWTAGAWDGANDYLFNNLKDSEVLIDGSTVLPGSKYHYFYAFANDASVLNAKETAFVIQALFDADGSGTTYDEDTVFYPVIIGKKANGYIPTIGGTTGLVSRNTIYKIGVIIKSKGASSPDATIEDGTIGLTVGVADWEPIDQDVTF